MMLIRNCSQKNSRWRSLHPSLLLLSSSKVFFTNEFVFLTACLCAASLVHSQLSKGPLVRGSKCLTLTVTLTLTTGTSDNWADTASLSLQFISTLLFCVICSTKHVNLEGSVVNVFCMPFVTAFIHQ